MQENAEPQKVTYAKEPGGQEYKLGLEEGVALLPAQRKRFPGLETWHNSIPRYDQELRKQGKQLPSLIITRITAKNGVDMGHGVFTKRAIKEGEVVLLYTGEYLSLAQLLKEGPDRIFPYASRGGRGKDQAAIDAERIGGVGRFANHLPTPEELEKYYAFTGKTKREDIATANIGCASRLVIQNQHVANIFVAIRDIAAGEQLGLSYGLNDLISRR